MTNRAEAVRPFYVMEIMARAQRRPAEAPEVVSMVVGEPDFPTPAPIIRAAREALDENRIRYTHALGLDELRQAIAQDYQDWPDARASSGRFEHAELKPIVSGERPCRSGRWSEWKAPQ